MLCTFFPATAAHSTTHPTTAFADAKPQRRRSPTVHDPPTTLAASSLTHITDADGLLCPKPLLLAAVFRHHLACSSLFAPLTADPQPLSSASAFASLSPTPSSQAHLVASVPTRVASSPSPRPLRPACCGSLIRRQSTSQPGRPCCEGAWHWGTLAPPRVNITRQR